MNPELWMENFLIARGLGLEMTNYALLGIGSIILLVACLVGNFVTKKFIIQGIQKFIKNSKNDWDDIFLENKVFNSLSTLVPLILIEYLSPTILSNFTSLIPFVHIVVKVSLVFVITSVLIKALKAFEEVSTRIPSFKDKPIMSYVQLANIMIYVV
ncbi:MAG: hypothetical protein OR994_08425, partial [Candidatus Poseidoniales archaeon]|nr:hypothetical protein [Candidatus Poseidoniales archaeon]